MTRLLKLYPKKWRERYEDEVAALLEEHHLSTMDRVNMVVSAGRARLNPRFYRWQWNPQAVWRGGLAAVVTAACMMFVLVLATSGIDSVAGWLVIISAIPTLSIIGTLALALRAYGRVSSRRYGLAWRRGIVWIAGTTTGLFVLLEAVILQRGNFLIHPVVLLFPVLPSVLFALVVVTLFTAATAFSRHRRSARVAS